MSGRSPAEPDSAAVSVHGAAAHDSFTLDVALDLVPGGVVAVVGPNGAGKTTLLRVCAGLTPLDRGTVRIAGATVDDPAAGAFVPPERRAVGVVFQDYLLFPHLRVIDNVAFGLRAQGVRRRAADERARDWLDRFGLGDKASSRPAGLSGGEAQRVAIARALVVEPSLLLLDEPLAALDAQHRASLRRDLRALLADFSGTCVLVSHDPVDAFSLADRVVVLEDGRVVQDGPPRELTSQPRSRYVADLVGVNLYEGFMRDGAVEVPGAHVAVADDGTADPGAPVLATIAPRAVVLHPDRPAGTARNAWPGTVDRVERIGDRARVHVDGVVPITAEVTAAAVDALGLRPGVEVWAAVKATDIRVTPA